MIVDAGRHGDEDALVLEPCDAVDHGPERDRYGARAERRLDREREGRDRAGSDRGLVLYSDTARGWPSDVHAHRAVGEAVTAHTERDLASDRALGPRLRSDVAELERHGTLRGRLHRRQRRLRRPRGVQPTVWRIRRAATGADRGARAEVPLVGHVRAGDRDVEADVVRRIHRERLLRDDHLVVVLELLRRVVDRELCPVRCDDLGSAHLHVLSRGVHDHDRIAHRT